MLAPHHPSQPRWLLWLGEPWVIAICVELVVLCFACYEESHLLFSLHPHSNFTKKHSFPESPCGSVSSFSQPLQYPIAIWQYGFLSLFRGFCRVTHSVVDRRRLSASIFSLGQWTDHSTFPLIQHWLFISA